MKLPLLILTVGLLFSVSASAQWRRDFSSGTPAPTPVSTTGKEPQNYSAASTVGITTSMDALNDTVKLNNGDILSYRVVEDGKDPIPVRIGDSGDVEAPLIGRVEATGKTCRQLAYDIKAQLEKSYYKRATVILGIDTFGGKSKGKVTLMGDVRLQGEMDIPSDESFTVAKVILRAGGLGDFADMRKIKLIRKIGPDYKTFILDMKPIFKDGKLEKDPPVEPGDTIIVPEKLWNF
jgi:protein involved in polysaccharide export with SLBB domain